jgi:hypothetical protein
MPKTITINFQQTGANRVELPKPNAIDCVNILQEAVITALNRACEDKFTSDDKSTNKELDEYMYRFGLFNATLGGLYVNGINKLYKPPSVKPTPSSTTAEAKPTPVVELVVPTSKPTATTEAKPTPVSEFAIAITKPTVTAEIKPNIKSNTRPTTKIAVKSVVYLMYKNLSILTYGLPKQIASIASISGVEIIDRRKYLELARGNSEGDESMQFLNLHAFRQSALNRKLCPESQKYLTQYINEKSKKVMLISDEDIPYVSEDMEGFSKGQQYLREAAYGNIPANYKQCDHCCEVKFEELQCCALTDDDEE